MNRDLKEHRRRALAANLKLVAALEESGELQLLKDGAAAFENTVQQLIEEGEPEELWEIYRAAVPQFEAAVARLTEKKEKS